MPPEGLRGRSAAGRTGTSALPGRPLEADLLEFIGRGVDGPKDDAEFNALALRLFGYQFERNGPYRAFCERRGRTPASVGHWREVPAVPIAGFKEAMRIVFDEVLPKWNYRAVPESM